MSTVTGIAGATCGRMSPRRDCFWRNVLLPAAGAAALLASPPAVAADPAAGDVFVYRIVNGYNKELRGRIEYRVQKADSNGITYAVTPDPGSGEAARNEIYTKEGNWLRHSLDSHGQKLEYVFSPPFPAYAFPLEPGRTWSSRVNATVQGVGTRSVRVDGKVLGTERIHVPAGEFDTIKVQRTVYPGDATAMHQETKITQMDWYASALGRPVRSETRSEYVDLQFCSSSVCVHYGNWDVVELVDAGSVKR